MNDNICIHVPRLNITLYPGSTIRLSRFDTTEWVLSHGWFEFSGNRAICGWYLSSKSDKRHVRPLQITDLDDIYLVG